MVFFILVGFEFVPYRGEGVCQPFKQSRHAAEPQKGKSPACAEGEAEEEDGLDEFPESHYVILFLFIIFAVETRTGLSLANNQVGPAGQCLTV